MIQIESNWSGDGFKSKYISNDIQKAAEWGKKQRLSDWGEMYAAYRKRTLNIRSQTGCKQWIKKDILCRP